MSASQRSSRSPSFTRRTVLRGAGVALALPWLASLQSRNAKAQALPPPRRFMPIYLPNGAPELWQPVATGAGDSWQLSSVLASLAPLKSQLTVISGLETGSVFNADGSNRVPPEHGLLPGAWLTCADSRAVRQRLDVKDANGVSADQLVAAHAGFVGTTPLPSLQVGLASCASYCDGQPCSLGRSVSWSAETKPLYKLVDPLEVFNVLAGVAPSGLEGQEGANARAARQSVLDAVLESANVVRPKLSTDDTRRMDEFLESVRAVEKRIEALTPSGPGCQPPGAPTFPHVSIDSGYTQNTATYDKGVHADLMNDLIAWAFQCNLTRVVSYMLDDEYSDFSYNTVPLRQFTATSSTPSTGFAGTYSSAQHGSVDAYATITWWNVGKVAALCQKLSQLKESDGSSVLDNSVIFLGSAMHGSDHAADRLPALLIGAGGGALQTDLHVDLGKRPLRDLYFTLLNQVFGMGISDFGVNRTGAPAAIIQELVRA